MTNINSVLKIRDITLLTKVHIVKAMVSPVVTYGYEGWAIKKAECWRIGAFELWYWRRLLRVPWTATRSNQSFLRELSPEYSLEGLMLKLKLQYSGHLLQRTDLLEKTLMLGKIEGRRSRRQRMKWLNGISNSMGMSLSKMGELVMDWEAWHVAGHGVTELDMTQWLNWTELIFKPRVDMERNFVQGRDSYSRFGHFPSNRSVCCSVYFVSSVFLTFRMWPWWLKPVQSSLTMVMVMVVLVDETTW